MMKMKMKIPQKNVSLTLALAAAICLAGGLSTASAFTQELVPHEPAPPGPDRFDIPAGTDVFSTITDLSSTDAAQGIVPTIRFGNSAIFGSDAFLTNGEWTGDDGASDGAIYALSGDRDSPEGIGWRAALQIDLGSVQPIGEVNVFSRHLNTRLRQAYNVYGSADGSEPPIGDFPTSLPANWTLIDSVDTGDASNGVLVPDDPNPPIRDFADGVLASSSDAGGSGYRYILVDIVNPASLYSQQFRDDNSSFFGRETNYQEIDVHVIPEPATMVLVGLGLGGLFVRRRRG
ncbi:PEP-CTERM sorting domain-containing protein [Pirellulales bacterium]|nr:PEP-CTERM sorting domain-containing protein [Pirellulales bacterium]